MEGKQGRERFWWWAAVGTIAVVGLVLRVAAAQGGLWTDEAWSVVYAAQARDAVGVFLRINHDNNHHLYSLWLQAVGPAASPLLARAPAILAGALSVVLAALFAGRRSSAAGIVAALLFALSPALVVFGSEARGYAMMVLAALLMLLIVSDAIDGPPVRHASLMLTGLAIFGMFSHLTVAAPVAIAALWFYLEKRARTEPRTALRATARLMGPALVATASAVIFVFTAAMLSPTGMRIGGYEPFSAFRFASALNDLTLWSIGVAAPWPWLVPLLVGLVAVALFVVRPDWLGSRARLYALLILAVPVGAGLLQAGNTSFARYYLASAIGLLLLVAEWIGRGLARPGAARAGAFILVAAIVAVSGYRDSLLVAIDRGRPDRPVSDMAAISPAGARIAFTTPRLKAVVGVAAERTGYPARFAGGCDKADFLLAAQLRWSPPPPRTTTRCGVPMVAIDSSVTIPITGDSWVLYRPQELAKLRSR